MPKPRPVRSDAASGLINAVAAYVLWGVLPLYFLQLRPAGSFEVVAWRIVFALLFCAVLATVLRAWGPIVAIVRQPRLLLMMGLAAALIFINWQTYVYAAFNDLVIESSLGYFMNPIVTVLLGVILLRERLSVLQWVAVGVSLIAVLVIAIGYGGFPWVALTLAFSFGFYGYVKKSVGPRVDALSGLAIETAWLVPIAIIALVVVSQTSGLVFGTAGPANVVLLVGVGVATAIPLLLFAAAARRLSLVSIGLVQYIAPILQFIIGFAVLHEAMPPSRWIGFGLVWLALIVLSADLVRRGRAARRSTAVVA